MRAQVITLILAGGAGMRLYPLTKHRSKPAVPLIGKYCLIDVPISNCINSDCTKIFVLTQYNSASLNRHISRTYRFSNFSDGFVEVLAADQRPDSPQWAAGTADSVRHFLDEVLGSGATHVLILAGDHLYRMDYRLFLARHFETGADVTVAVTPCDAENASRFGLVKTDEGGRIIEFREKPKADRLEQMRAPNPVASGKGAQPTTFLASMGLYVFEIDVLRQVLVESPDAMDFGRDVIPKLLGEVNVQAHIFDDYWEDIGTISAFYNAHMDMVQALPRFNFFDASAPIFTQARYLPNTQMLRCEVENSSISEGSIISGGKLIRSIIGPRSRISSSVIEESVIMGADFYEDLEDLRQGLESNIPHIGIGEGSLIRRAIIDKNARIGAGVKLVNEHGWEEYDSPDGSLHIRDGIIVVPENAVIADGTLI